MNEILLVDDDYDYLHQVKSLLMREGMAVKCAENGVKAISELKGNNFALMITDLNMPEMDGFALTRNSSVIAPDMPVIMITGSISPETTRLARELGIAKVFAKTFDPDELIALINKLQGNIDRNSEGG